MKEHSVPKRKDGQGTLAVLLQSYNQVNTEGKILTLLLTTFSFKKTPFGKR